MALPFKGRAERPRDRYEREKSQQKNRGGQPFFQGKCFECGKQGHRAADCRNSSRPRRAQADDRRIGNVQPRRDQHGDRRNGNAAPSNRPRNDNNGGTDKRCYNCGKNGHVARDCTAAKKECKTCGRLGHNADECKRKAPAARRSDNTCNNCGRAGHLAKDCRSNGKRDTPPVNREKDDKSITCFNCGGKGHIASSCNNAKSVRAQQAPWPQTLRLEKSVTTLPRNTFNDWSSEELSAVKEFNRLSELLIDLHVTCAKLEIRIENASKEGKKVVHWNRVTNTKKDIGTAPVSQEATLRLQHAEFIADKAACKEAMYVAQNVLVKASITKAQSLQEMHLQHHHEEPALFTAYLTAATERLQADTIVTKRIDIIVPWLNSMFGAVTNTIIRLVKNIKDAEMLRKATADARNRTIQVSAAAQGNTVVTTDDSGMSAEAKRQREAERALEHAASISVGFGSNLNQ